MSRLRNLYTYLITNNPSGVDGWYEDYKTLTCEVAAVRSALKDGHHLKEPETYAKTKSFNHEDGWKEFTDQLLRSKKNGVSGTGQSVLSHENFERFISDDAFIARLEQLITEPNKKNFNAFAGSWEDLRVKYHASRNPLLINRTLSACTLNVTSTVNTSDFETVYSWLLDECVIPRNDELGDWYDKNVYLMIFLRGEFKDEIEKGKTNEHLLSIFVWKLFEYIANPFSFKKQVVKYGAPGTGKTYSAMLSTRLLFDIWREEFGASGPFTHEKCCQTVQFHPSFAYEDFMEGLRPELDDNRQVQLRLRNGIFKKICIEAGKWEMDTYGILGHGNDLAKIKWPNLTINDLLNHASKLSGPHWAHIFSNPDKSKRVSDAVPPFFFIIDEINRAELSRVLGELMFCLEYRGTEGAIYTQYAALNTADTGMLAVGDSFKFFIPHNVYVIGTMNTIDRSVESFDLALRRRFRWERMDPDILALRYHLRESDKRGHASRPWVGLAEDLARLNEQIVKTDLLGEDYQIGHAYLMNLRYSPNLNISEIREKLWEDNIRSLLEEYLRGSGRSDELLPDFRKSFGVR
jgi:5-methylcytosine-specific restriction enzyme B